MKYNINFYNFKILFVFTNDIGYTVLLLVKQSVHWQIGGNHLHNLQEHLNNV